MTKELNPKVDAYIGGLKAWKAEVAKLRQIVLGFDLDEELKWGVPCYTLRGKNVVLIHEFKDYCAILFVKGALLKDPDGILVQQTENVQAARQARFTGVGEIAARKAALKACIAEAIEVEKAGLKVQKKETADFPVPEEFQARLSRDPDLKAAFQALTPGRQRAYLLYFSGAKQATTRQSRIEKCAPAIREGKGLDD
jgi:uncharacterized protein YdeI (YjbR/CyaY-like superfamily)